MEMDIYLLSLNISGIKNIEKEIRLDFYKQTIDKNFKPGNYRIKAIYGENGSGKTGIVTAVQILRELLLKENYLNETSNQVFLEEIVNKITHKLHLEIEILVEREEHLQVYQYIVEVSNDKMDRFEIIFEKLSHKIITSKNAKYDTVFECHNGELLYFRAEESVQQEIKKHTANLLSKSTFFINYLLYYASSGHYHKKSEWGMPALDLFAFVVTLDVNLEYEDQHRPYLLQASLKNESDDFVSLQKKFEQYLDNLENRVTSRKISKKFFKVYKNRILQMERFLQLFKPDIQSIDIEKREEKDYYECRLAINYGDYRVDTEFESTGIKKLIRLFGSLQAAADGGIVFIDEMDSNINDIYLCRLVEFMMLYGKGQLCFTTHNTSPMSVLKKGKKSIDFLSNDNRIVPWTTNGNYQPESLYRQGLIKYLPFNIEPEDFIGILGE